MKDSTVGEIPYLSPREIGYVIAVDQLELNWCMNPSTICSMCGSSRGIEWISSIAKY